MSRGLTRRTFLKVGMTTAAAAVLSGCTVDLSRPQYLQSYVQPPEEALPGDNLYYATTCRQCPAGCGMIVRVSNGRARKVEGNPQHPVNRGKLCARGQAVVQELYDADRLRHPVKQDSRGSANFTPQYWEDMLGQVGGALKSAGSGVAFLGGISSTHLAVVVGRFMQSIGAPPPVFYNLEEELQGVQGLGLAHQDLFGSGALPIFDVANADVVFSFGANFLEDWLSPMAYARAFKEMRRKSFGQRGYLAQFEPRFSATAACSDRWIGIRPGTEGLVALALGKIIVDQKLGRDATVEPFFAKVDVAAMAAASGVTAEDLNTLARAFAGGRSPVAIPGNQMAAAPNRAPAVAAVEALNVLLGRLGQPGGVFLPAEMTGQNFTPVQTATFGDVQKLIERMNSGQVKVMLIHGTNPVFELPPSAGFTDALVNVPLVISFSPIVDETAVQADLVLPDNTNLESWGYHVVGYGAQQVVSGLQPVTRQVYDTHATVDVLLALVQQLGGSLAQALPWKNEAEFLKDVLTPLNTTNANADVFWSEWRRQGGWWSSTSGLRTPTAGKGFSAPVTLAAPDFQGDAETFPFFLRIFPSVGLGDGRGANKPWLQETPDPITSVSWQTWVEVNPATAKRIGVKDDDVVKVTSLAGEITCQVYTNIGVPEDVVAIPVGQGHDQCGRWARNRGSNPMKLMQATAANDGILNWGTVRVGITPTGQGLSLARLDNREGVEYVRQLGIDPAGSPSIF
jgi:anaerobic selenocysteine-containing dehydrogenase